jgi:CelD/BcsL family acetyltransferase involved in cellulose biosynthesis
VTLRTEIIADTARFTTIRQAWRQLWERSGGFVFQSHDWIAGWLAGMGDRRDVKLQIAVAWEGDQLCGAMPCAVHRRSGLRVLSFAAQLFSDYCDCLVDPGYERTDVLPLLWDSLNEVGGFDLINLQQLRPDARCREFLDGLASNSGRLRYGDRNERCMRIDNKWQDGEAFFRSLNKKGRNNHTRGKRILAELGGEVSFRSVEPTEDAAPMFDEIMRLKEAWLRANDPNSPLLGPDAAVLRAILNKAWASGIARIFLLECGGKVAAASINFVYAGRMEAYFTAYEAAFDRASPGTILIVEYARWSFDRGLSHVDFLRGEEAFKFRMANAETLLSSFAGARTLIGQVAVSSHRWLSRRRQRQEVASTPSEVELEAVG